MTLVAGIDFSLKLLMFAWFGYAKRHFATSQKEPFGMYAVQITYVIGFGLNLWLFASLPESPNYYSILGIFTTILSAIVFYYAVEASRTANLHVVFSRSTGSFLVSNGIYRFVRHPFYLTYIIYWFSWCLSLMFSILSISVFFALLMLYILSMRCEDKELEKNFENDYRKYRKRTSCLLPYIF